MEDFNETVVPPRTHPVAPSELTLYNVSKRRKEKTMEVLSEKTMTVRSICGYSLSKYKLKIEIDQIEKERRQSLHRLKEDKHMFKMSVKLPSKYGQEYWSQHGEKFHANGEPNEAAAVVRIPLPSNKHKTEAAHKSVAKHKKKQATSENEPTTVSDLIAIMRAGSAPSRSMHTKSQGHTGSAPIESIHHCDVIKNVIEATMAGSKRSSDNKLDRLQVLLENYEVFVPKDIRSADTSSGGSVEDFLKLSDAVGEIGFNNLKKSKSLSCADERLLCRQGTSTESITKFELMNGGLHRGITDDIGESFINKPDPKIHGIITSSNDEKKIFWRSPSRRIKRQEKSSQHMHHASEAQLEPRPHAHLLDTRLNSAVEKGYSSAEYIKTYDIDVFLSTEELPPEVIARVNTPYEKTASWESLEARKSRHSPHDAESEIHSHFVCNGRSAIDSDGTGNTQGSHGESNKTVHGSHKRNLRSISRHGQRSINSRARLKLSTVQPVLAQMPKRDAKKEEKRKSDGGSRRRPAPDKPDTHPVTSMMVKGTAFQQDVKDQHEKETRAKMDKFFARLDVNKAERPRVRSRARTATFASRATEANRKPVGDKHKREKSYHRATPWPVEVWG
ncbi:uncharacterized protein LOC5504762 [Nematostella vectensis]|uniref:uncharacterized protein LOC5504762 n=1 Tax=Nematostella vectensis TaxID=45351 RepID=UPI00138FFDD4|nr:uncharacterized protein LOC5504762 [Nematostella vectensis]XP_032228982.1 uncharacterized protein LOC5504762 [Nematostella vectensis]XP_032228983.1 uncharacterized protein LOC5504762 [Nematostella vectensis]XP_032228984.1 uncharacterized protein LOC5504762 [Nematostella vectensis]XP_032228985.1 uncharacterized protein LOC5504762 [Nematostella vectensis]XP_032228986.1 uncharacterized protein LOC5504762 [Nematostella vectensis]XP_032228987.1 uncharacterized protein LOC5504762 [Nematostella v